jgi:phage-related protein
MDSTSFVYDGIKSEDMGIYLVNMKSGMKEEHFLADRELVSEQVFGNDISYIYGWTNKPLRIVLSLSPLEGLWTTEKRREVSRWLDCGRFAEFYSTDDVNKRYFLLYNGASNLYTNSNQQGYIDIEFMNISPYSFSPVYDETYNFSTITLPTELKITNDGDTILYPQEMWITKYGAGDFSISNATDGGREFKFTGLADQEVVYVQNQERFIETSLSNTFRYDNFNGNYLRLVYGINTLTITGAAIIRMKYRYELKG